MYEKTSRAHRTLPVSMPLCQQAVWARVVDWVGCTGSITVEWD